MMSSGKSTCRVNGSASRLALAAAAALSLTQQPASANPEGGTVVAGEGTISAPSPGEVVVTQSSNTLILNWDSFDIDADELTRFLQPSASALAVNRIGGNDPSLIYGSVTANGRIILINPNGLLFGDTARINVGSLVATTHDAADSDLLAGRYTFDISGSPTATITNRGVITANPGGSLAFVAPGVSNTGTMTATLGSITLGAASKFTLDFTGDNLISFPVGSEVIERAVDADGTPVEALVSNSGTLSGSKVVLSARAAAGLVANAVNMDGTVIATRAVADGGDIVLLADNGEFAEIRENVREVRAQDSHSGIVSIDGGTYGVVNVDGTIQASGTMGGSVTVTGESVSLGSHTVIDASGSEGGGTILVGGGYQGQGPLVHAKVVDVAADAKLRADALVRGDGGTVVVWSDGQTRFMGSISARGGSESGNGGVAEVSSKGNLSYFGNVDLRSPAGTLGSLLLDPRNVTITTDALGTSPAIPSAPAGPIVLVGIENDSVLSVAALLTALETANVTVATSGDGTQEGNITVATNIAWMGSNSLTLSAHHNVIVNDGATISNVGIGNLRLRADSDGSGQGTVILNGTRAIDFENSSGTITLFYNPSSNPTASLVNASSYLTSDTFDQHVAKNLLVVNQLTAYMLVNTVHDLQNINNNLSGRYALGRNIEASQAAGWNNGQGFDPIGDYETNQQFTGTLLGNDHEIRDLTISRPNTLAVGLFALVGADGEVRDIHLSNATIIAGPSTDAYVGGFVGINYGNISGSSISGAVTGEGEHSHVGGFVGYNAGGTIQLSSSSAAVSGGNTLCCGDSWGVGGFVGLNFGLISQSSASGRVTGTIGDGGTAIGGFVGINGCCVTLQPGTIEQSLARGDVYAPFVASAGGFAGYNNGGVIHQSYARGGVRSDHPARPAAGFANLNGATITQSYATGHLTSAATPAGLTAFFPGAVTWSYWDVDTTGAASSVDGIGLTTVQLKSELPEGFDPSVWAFDPAINDGYPHLRWQGLAPPASPVSVSFGSSQNFRLLTELLQVGEIYRELLANAWFLPAGEFDRQLDTILEIIAQQRKLDASALSGSRSVFVSKLGTEILDQRLLGRELSASIVAGYLVDYVGLAANVYADSTTDTTYTKIHTEELPTGFAYAVYEKDGKVVLAFRGTDESRDWITSFTQWRGKDSWSQLPALAVAQRVIAEFGASNVTIVGHSLGGYLAQYVGSWTGVDVVAVDSQPFDDRSGVGPYADNILSTAIRGEFLHRCLICGDKQLGVGYEFDLPENATSPELLPESYDAKKHSADLIAAIVAHYAKQQISK